ncbi:hypothetical protein [Mesorhizobium ventifaucium]|uniref:Uncharacterized protein n=1 Tax=Mesorhizobium ventifaucium TaxID=666020 RepID=A0ABM9E906_9HYPH|nr:hypothetical protein [Mesorhizobium ventifaucium]CAH2405627.1 conserved hypothetical protein [Mesorhizobium ventifaucium]
MIDLINDCELVGVADPLGKKTGFLIPVFFSPASNALLVEERSSNGRVAGYSPLHPQETEILPTLRGQSRVGDRPHWAFGLGDGVLVGRGTQRREELKNALRGPFLMARPMLALEVTDFLGLKEDRNNLAAKIFADLRRKNAEVARRWRDIAILIPDIKAAWLNQQSDLTAGRKRGAIPTLAAQVREPEVAIRFSSSANFSGGTFRVHLERIVRNCLAELPDLYEEPNGDWIFRFQEARDTRDALDASPQARALIYLADDALPFSEPNRSGGYDSIGIYPQDKSREFIGDVLASETPSYVTFLLDDAYGAILDGAPELHHRRPLGLGVRAGRSKDLSRSEVQALSRYPHPTVVITQQSPPGFLRDTFSGELRDAVNLMSPSWYGDSQWIFPSRACAFMRARGLGPQKMLDALAQLYERCRQLKLDTTVGVAFLAMETAPSMRAYEFARVLFPQLDWKDLPKEPRVKQPIDAALLAAIDSNVDDEYRWQSHCKIIETILRKRGWETVVAVETNHEKRLNLHASAMDVELKILRDKPRGGRTSYNQPLDLNIENIDKLALVEDANAGMVLSRLERYGDLLVTPRDLCCFDPAADSVWSLHALQLKRMSHWMVSKSRTLHVALICRVAMERGMAEVDDAERLFTALKDPGLGQIAFLASSRLKTSELGCELKLRLVSRGSNIPLPDQFSKLGSFILRVDQNGPAMFSEE